MDPFYVSPKTINLLYIPDYKVSYEDDVNYKSIKKCVDNHKKFKLFGINWELNENNPPSVIFAEIMKKCYDEKIDIVIGHSIGGYFASGLEKISKILINPLLIKSQLISFDINPEIFNDYNNLLVNTYSKKNTKRIWMCSSSKDNVLGTSSFNYVDKLFVNKKLLNKNIIPNGEHNLNENQIKILLNKSLHFVIYKNNELKQNFKTSKLSI